MQEWAALGSPKSVQIVELGPGRGTLSWDMLRTFKQLKNVWNETKLSLNLVEISQSLATIQYNKLCGDEQQVTNSVSPWKSRRLDGNANGIPVSWYTSIDEVPKSHCTFFIAHEFFDALPIHKFVKVDDSWKEVFVDIDEDAEKGEFQFVVLPQPTLACKTLIKVKNCNKIRERICKLLQLNWAFRILC